MPMLYVAVSKMDSSMHIQYSPHTLLTHPAVTKIAKTPPKSTDRTWLSIYLIVNGPPNELPNPLDGCLPICETVIKPWRIQ